MSSKRLSAHGELPDEIIPPTGGHEPNPNPEDEVAANRARFEEAQRKLQQDRQAAANAVREVQHKVEGQYEAAIQDPEHQKFVAEQIEHEYTDPVHAHGGREREGDEYVGPVLGGASIGRHVPVPTTPRDSEELNNEE